jgi:CubicO group peptidase (beta-lactamase class C family)
VEPSVRQFSAWLEAFNSGDRDRYAKFLAGSFPSRLDSLDKAMAFRERTGELDLRELERVTATEAAALVQERDSDQFARVEWAVDAAEPHVITSLNVAAIHRPAEFPIARLTEDEAITGIQDVLRGAAAAERFSGTVLIEKKGQVLFSHAYGLADRERGIPNNLLTRFRVGSMNKMFTGVAVLQLAEAGKVELTAPLGEYLTGYRNRGVAAEVTIHHLLTHTGGMGGIFGPEFEAHRLELRTLDDYARLYGDRGPEFEPGSRWRYSNYGYILLGAVIEKVTGQTYYDYVQARIYEPAGLTATGSEPEDQPVPGRSVGYMKPPGTIERVPNTETLPYRGTSAGGGYSTAGDLARFARALLDHQLLRPESTRLLITGKTEHAPGERYAYGFEDHRDTDGNGSVGHNGAAPGMNGHLRIYPRSGCIVVVLANMDPPAAQRIAVWLDARLPTQDTGGGAGLSGAEGGW